MRKITLLSLITITTLFLLGCDAQKTEQASAGSISLANPASTYCVAQGGTLSIESEEDGQVGYCTLPSGERVEEWQLYKRDHKESNEDIEVTEMLQTPNPAAEYCLKLGGTSDLSSGNCILPNGEKIDQWQLFRRDHLFIDPQNR
ncbi:MULTISPECIES: DUF333 domain-containing protein [unclassified Shewanella]|jgi:putative hemolysin|uniref:DUF333 domain-containing protein n=1 Tax=unclassified Shewanella TaxID=196818 RepID=UPI0018E3A538|nr:MULTISPECIES: DUF333 domain-containing protein [unclassified Shewanella]